METILRRVCTPHRARTFVSAATALFALLVLAPSSLEASAPAAKALQFINMPGRAVAGQDVTVSVGRARAGATCSLKVAYGGGTTQPGLSPKIATHGGVSWTWTIPDTVQANRARLVASCTGSKQVLGGLLVVGSLIPARLSVEKDGFSVRTSSTGTADVSYGVIIRNHSPNADAQSVHVLVNFVLANDHLLGSASSTIPVIEADSSYALGNNLAFPGAAPIARLEVVIQVGAVNRHVGHTPALANVTIEPGTYDHDWVGDVAGEVINNDAHQTLQSVSFSAVIFDAAGNILGGGYGSTPSALLPPGTRQVFKLSSGGFKDIPVAQASSAMVTATPTWQQSTSAA